MTNEELRAMYRHQYAVLPVRPTYVFDVEVGDEPEEGVEFVVEVHIWPNSAEHSKGRSGVRDE